MNLVLPSAQLVDEAKNLLNFNLVVGTFDRQVLCPNLAWCEEFAWWAFRNKPKYLAEKRDCEDISMWARVQATESLVKNRGIGNVGHSFTFCYISISFEHELNGIPGSGESHITNIVRTDEGWRFFETQTGLHCPAVQAIELGAVPLRGWMFV